MTFNFTPLKGIFSASNAKLLYLTDVFMTACETPFLLYVDLAGTGL